MDNPMLSVIVPIYQVEAYLPRCLDSILAQTRGDFELILVDDGSTDRCAEIMADYARRDGRIRQVHKQNGGLSSARNAGMDMARGKYLLFVDSDDYIAPELVADAVRTAEETGAELTVWNYEKVDDSRAYGPFFRISDETLNLDAIGLEDYFYRYWIPNRFGFEAWNKLYVRRVVEQNGLRFQPNREILAEDQLFNAMYILHTHRVATLSQVYSCYYQREGSIMNAPKPRCAYRLMNLAERLYDYALAQPCGRELKNVLPVLCYCLLLTIGISTDPSMEDVYCAMEEFSRHGTMRQILRALISPAPLTMYTIKTHNGVLMHIRARLFAMRWLRGDVRGAAALVHRA